MRMHISSFEGNPLGRTKDVPSTLTGWGQGAHYDLLSLMCYAVNKGVWGQAQRGAQASLQACFITPFIFVKKLQQGDIQNWYYRSQESYNASFGWWESNAREGSKKSKVTQRKLCMVGIGRMEDRRTQESHNTHFGWWVSVYLGDEDLENIFW